MPPLPGVQASAATAADRPPCPTTTTICTPIGGVAWMVGYEHFWCSKWSTNGVYSGANTSDEPYYTSAINQQINYGAVNLLYWFLGDHGWMGVEYLYGHRQVFGGGDDNACRASGSVCRSLQLPVNATAWEFVLLPRLWVVTLVVVTLALAATSGAATKVVPGTFVWHDLVTDNPAAAKKFYGELFGWTFEPGKGVEPDYTIIRQRGSGRRIVAPKQQTSPQWLSYVVVADVDRAGRGVQAGGWPGLSRTAEREQRPRVAAVADAQGAPIGLASRGPLDGVSDALPEINRWLWMDYVARDEAPALDFYTRLLGYESQTETRETATYYRLANGRPRAGLFKTPWPRETSIWLPYIRVADPEASAKRAQELGG